jgi:hypothetical protein
MEQVNLLDQGDDCGTNLCLLIVNPYCVDYRTRQVRNNTAATGDQRDPIAPSCPNPKPPKGASDNEVNDQIEQHGKGHQVEFETWPE